MDLLLTLPNPQPLIGDAVAEWLEPRAVRVLEAEGIKTFSALTAQIPFFAAHPELTARARELVVSNKVSTAVPWERLVVPADVDSTRGCSGLQRRFAR